MDAIPISLSDELIDRIAARLEERLISRQVAFLAPQARQPVVPPQDRLIREADAASMLGVSVAHLRRLRRKGRFQIASDRRPILYDAENIAAARAVLRGSAASPSRN